MPSPLHENLIEVFRARPELAAELLSDPLGVAVPEHESVRRDSGDLPDLVPTEYRADAVVVLSRADEPALAVVIEVQLGRDSDKRWSWPVYVATLRARMRCPVELLVVCSEATVAAWCAGPIQLGVSGSQVMPMVLDLDLSPFVTDTANAESVPELAVLSAIAHGGGKDHREVLPALLRSLAGVKAERRQLYFGLVYGVLPEAARRYLEEIMSTEIDQEFSPYERRILASRRAQILATGEARNILAVLEARQVAVPADRRQLIDECTDLDQLDRWLTRAATATSIEELFG